MSATDWQQLIGSGFIALLFGLHMALSLRRGVSCHCRREAMLCVSGWGLSVVVLRMFALADILTQEEARTVNGLTAALFAAIQMQITLNAFLIHGTHRPRRR